MTPWKQAVKLYLDGHKAQALESFVDAGLAAEDAGHDGKAREIWEAVARRYESSGPILERLALCYERLCRYDDAHATWRVAAAKYLDADHSDEAAHARARARELRTFCLDHTGA